MEMCARYLRLNKHKSRLPIAVPVTPAGSLVSVDVTTTLPEARRLETSLAPLTPSTQSINKTFCLYLPNVSRTGPLLTTSGLNPLSPGSFLFFFKTFSLIIHQDLG